MFTWRTTTWLNLVCVWIDAWALRNDVHWLKTYSGQNGVERLTWSFMGELLPGGVAPLFTLRHGWGMGAHSLGEEELHTEWGSGWKRSTALWLGRERDSERDPTWRRSKIHDVFMKELRISPSWRSLSLSGEKCLLDREWGILGCEFYRPYQQVDVQGENKRNINGSELCS